MPFMNRSPLSWLLAAGSILLCPACSAAPTIKTSDPRSPLSLVQTIPLPDTKGRIDHLAVDVDGRRLLVAEVANGTVDVIDLRAGKVVGRVSGLKEPQGVAWLPRQDEFVVACGDGSVRFFAGRDRHEVATVALGDDADDVRVDPRNGQVVVGYGKGGLATINPATHKLVGRVLFRGHPEGFQLSGGRAFVNVPDDGAILALDMERGTVAARWSTGVHRLNFPMAIDPAGQTITIAYRLPAAWARIDVRTGATVAISSTCGDSDDLFAAGDSELVVCGAGHVDLVRNDRIMARVETGGGARTGLYVPELRELFVAVPSRGKPAAIWALRLRHAD